MTFVSWRQRMSGDSSRRKRSTISVRARMLLIFQDAILRVWDIAADVAGLRPRCKARAAARQSKGPRSGGVERGPPSVVSREVDRLDRPGNRGKTRSGRPLSIGVLLS